MESRQKVKNLFDLLGLSQKYPQKITTCEALCIQPSMPGLQSCTDPKELYLHVLQMIMAYHKRCRANLLQISDSDASSATADPFDDIFSDAAADPFDDIFSDAVQRSSAIQVHPMDVILALLHCSDDFLRQDLMARLATCQLSIPLVLPDPFTGELTFLLWAMRSIIKEWKCIKGGKEQNYEGPLITFPIPMVAFVRFNEQEKSKSKLMNEVMSDTYHDRFFHRDCEGGDSEWLLGKGLIEISWYLPAAKSSDLFPEAVTFLNLHGDAREYETQVSFLSRMCLTTFVLISGSDLNERSTSVLKTLSVTPGGVVLLVCSDKSLPPAFQKLKEVIPKGKISGCMLKGKNADSVKKEIRLLIKKKLNERWIETKHKQTLEGGVQIAQDLGIKADESKPEFTQGYEMARALYDMIAGNVAMSKQRMLPLQGEKLWQAWAKMDKEEHRPTTRGGMTIEAYSDIKHEAKTEVRKQQLKILQYPPSTLMDQFIMSLSQSDDAIQDYFLHSLKLLLNDLSRKSMSSLQSDYIMERSKLLKYEREKDEKSTESTRDKVKKLQKTMVEASFGLEHLLRELAQIYEAASCCTEFETDVQRKYKNLPRLAAGLFVKGYPLELMDGDAAHVPERWIDSVMSEAKQMLNDPRVFVMSVLGLQSTGKSTLMNTAFGLQFNVSAGRCTRGAYMQLLPISEELKDETKCDYVLIVDTEGLRAPELNAEESDKHDNELATFVVGLANVTMVNIYGEVPGDMDDILQTTVHAFLRMKSVKLTPSCQFVHQNVSAIAAGKKGEMGRARFKDKLDLMTLAAAKEEERESDFKCFSDVIAFNSETDVHHFPGLWSGVPPMAPVDEGYSTKAIALKSHLLDMLKRSRASLLQAEKLSIVAAKTRSLWKALLNENFIFSFKNTLEVVVYNELDAQFIKWSRSLQSDMFKWRDKKEREIGVRSTAAELEDFQKKFDSELPAYVSHLFKGARGKMEEYFENSDHKHVLERWKKITNDRLDERETQLKQSTKQHFYEIINGLKARKEVESNHSKYRGIIAQNVKDLVDSLNMEKLKQDGDSTTDHEYLRGKFEQEWPKWMDKIKLDCVTKVRKRHNVPVLLQESLIEYFGRDTTKVLEKIQSKGRTRLEDWGKHLGLEVEPCSDHFKFKESFLRRLPFVGKASPKESHMRVARYVAEVACTRVSEHLRSKRGKNFHQSFITELLDIVDKVIGDESQKQADFTFTKDYKIVLSITACGFALREFTKMVEEFDKQNDPIIYLETEVKEKLFRVFVDQYHDTAGEKVAACAVIDVLATSIQTKVQRDLPTKLYEDISAAELPYLTSKPKLKRRILLDMGKHPVSVEKYFKYLSCPQSSLRDWIKVYMKEFCKRPSKITNHACNILRNEIKGLKTHIKKMSQCSYSDSETWLTDLCMRCLLDKHVNISEFRDLKGKQKLEDREHFEQEVLDGIDELENRLKESFRKFTVDDLDRKVGLKYDGLYNDLLGCDKTCPFCGEECDNSDKNHNKEHECHVHRPQCLDGWRDSNTQEMVVYICNASVGSKRRFLHQQSGEYRDYARYTDSYPNWNIPANNDAEACGYWKWFVGEYYDEIVETFSGIKANTVPPGWKKMKWHEAEDSLIKDFRDT